jgi:preprotein translocase subunit SecG
VTVISAFFVLALVFGLLGWRGVLKAYLVLVGLLSVLAILIQSGRGGGLAASLGGMGGDSLLGARSATPIAKATYVMFGLFIFISLLLVIPREPHSALFEAAPVNEIEREAGLSGSGMEGGAPLEAPPADGAEQPAEDSAPPAPESGAGSPADQATESSTE